MKLPREFCRLPLRFDAERLQAEAWALPESAWKPHPLNYPGNSAVRLISGEGGENDDLGGEMAATEHLRTSPYIRQVLATFGVAWSRSRLMMLGPDSQVPQHCDINHHWFHRVRLHIPVVTYPDVRFYCGAAAVHMRAGEAWLFDNWRPHRVVNPTPHRRIHLVADTVGNARFWNLARQGQWQGFNDLEPAMQFVSFDASRDPELLFERHNLPVIMPPGDVQVLLADLLADLAPIDTATTSATACRSFHFLAENFLQEWRHLWSQHGADPALLQDYAALRDGVRHRLQQIAAPVMMRSNQLSAMQVIDGRLLRHVVNAPGAEAFRKRTDGTV